MSKKLKAPEQVHKNCSTPREDRYHEYKEPEVAKPKEITKTKGRYKVALDIAGKKVYIGTYKSLDEALTELDRAKRDAWWMNDES